MTPVELLLSLPASTCTTHLRDGFTPAALVPLERLVHSAAWTFADRPTAETDESRRHLVTYTVLRSQGRVFAYRRGASGSEGRLHGRLSIGVGGHVNEEDIPPVAASSPSVQADHFRAAACREVAEEVDALPHVHPLSFLGWLCTSSSPVDRVHLGVVFALDLPEPVEAREDCLADGRWLTAAEVVATQDEMEGWSRVLVEAGVVGVEVLANVAGRD